MIPASFIFSCAGTDEPILKMPKVSWQILRKASRLLFFFILLLLVSAIAYARQTKLEYSIKRNGSEIGTVIFIQHLSGNKAVLKVESELKVRIIFLIAAKVLEETMYENGIMIWSTVYQKINGNEKVNKKTKLMGRNYVVTKGRDWDTINDYPIHFNLVCLYIKEPLNILKVYSDKFQNFLDIQKMGDHQYKIIFPDGNYNEYYYQNGLCIKVEVHHRFYRSSFELKPHPLPPLHPD